MLPRTSAQSMNSAFVRVASSFALMELAADPAATTSLHFRTTFVTAMMNTYVDNNIIINLYCDIQRALQGELECSLALTDIVPIYKIKLNMAN